MADRQSMPLLDWLVRYEGVVEVQLSQRVGLNLIHFIKSSLVTINTKLNTGKTDCQFYKIFCYILQIFPVNNIIFLHRQ